MGCDSSKSIAVCDKNGVNNQNGILGIQKDFCEGDIALIYKTWRLLHSDMVGNGTKVFLRIFEIEPFIKQLFGFGPLEGDMLVQHPRFRLHAGRFMQAVGASVENLRTFDLDSAMTPLLNSLGAGHVTISGVDMKFIEVFGRALVEVWQEVLESKFTPQAQAAWTKMFFYVTEQFRQGYLGAVTPGKK